MCRFGYGLAEMIEYDIPPNICMNPRFAATTRYLSTRSSTSVPMLPTSSAASNDHRFLTWSFHTNIRMCRF